jgi:hypothetical protein
VTLGHQDGKFSSAAHWLAQCPPVPANGVALIEWSAMIKSNLNIFALMGSANLADSDTRPSALGNIGMNVADAWGDHSIDRTGLLRSTPLTVTLQLGAGS